MARFPDHCIKLILILIICSTASAVFCFVEQVQATNKVVTIGEIKLYHEDGSTQMTSYNFPQFDGGMPSTCSKWFFIRNTGKQPVEISWSLTESSIPWNMKTIGYEYYETNICKYSFGLRQDSKGDGDYLAPEEKSILLNCGEEAKLCFELIYTGRPNTPEIFTLTVSFYATRAEA